MEEMNASMAGDVDAFREGQPTPPAEEEGSILVVTADGSDFFKDVAYTYYEEKKVSG